MRWRAEVTQSDSAAVGELVASTGFFDPAEQAIAVELVDEALTRGPKSDYQFLFADADGDGKLLGYTCFGRIPATVSSFDLYWIAVSPTEQRRGLGASLLKKTESMCLKLGGTRMFVDTAGRQQYAPTRAFYERMGYEKAAMLDDFYAEGDAKVIWTLSPFTTI